MKFVIHSPSGIEINQTQVQSVRTILADGKPLTILPRHAPLLAEIGLEPITTKKDGDERSYRVNNGILLVAENTVKVLTNNLLESETTDD